MSPLVFKILKPSATFHGIDYNERKKSKGKAALLYFNNFMHLQEGAKTIDRKEAKDFMDWWSASNKRIQNKQFHAILSCKGKSIPLKRLKDYGLEIMDKLGYKDNPILVYGPMTPNIITSTSSLPVLMLMVKKSRINLKGNAPIKSSMKLSEPTIPKK